MPTPAHKPTKPKRKKVMLYVAAGMGEIEIAAAMKLSRETIRKHYSDELAQGRGVIRAEILDMLKSAADQGNVTAMKHLDVRTSGEAQSNVAGTTGKKAEQAKAAAQAGAGTEWGDDLKPVVLTGRAN